MSSHDKSHGEVRTPEIMRQRIAEVIKNSRQKIAEELIRTGATPENPKGNSWIACFITRLQTLYNTIDMAQGVLPDSEIDSMITKLGAIEIEIVGLRDQQLNSFTPPPQDIQEGLFEKLDALVADDSEVSPDQL